MTQNSQVSAPANKQLPTPRGGSKVDTASTRPPVDLTSHQRSVALTWVARGVPIVPCSRTDKGALVPGFGRDAPPEQLAKFADPAQVGAWYSGRFKRAHVGGLTGRGADGRGLVVIDCDMPKDGAEPLGGRWSGCHGGTDVLELLAREAGAEWPETYSVVTPSGGLHLYFRQPEDGPLIGCATGAGGDLERPRPPHLGPLVDVRGIGGYIILAGSYSRAQGRPYERVSPSELLPQPLPEWLLELLRPAAAPAAPPRPPAPVRVLPTASRADRYAAAALRGEAEKVAAAGAGEYWFTISGAALRLAELHETAPGVLTERAVTDALVSAATSAGMEERAAVRAVRTAWARKAGHGAGAA